MKVNLQKRREVMARSMRLGHCICEPRRPCPCDVFTDQGICPCAGERPDPAVPGALKLTSLVRNPGCASKIAPGDLEQMLARLPAVEDSNVISGLAAADDAAIYRISENLYLVQTVDVFTPCVDDPVLFGRICAANCLSDIYAMGGTPRTALSILAFPSETLPGELMGEMLSGATQTLAEAGVALIGGHSIKDEEIKLGFAVTGTIDISLAASLDAPAEGDILLLTKPLGTGVLAFAEQVGRGHSEGMRQAVQSMATLNALAARAMIACGASGCTDITGFGLFGHLSRMLRNRNLTAQIRADRLPCFDGVLDLLRKDVIPGAIERNREYSEQHIRVEGAVDPACVNLGFDAQTSGGLLIAIPAARLDELLSRLRDFGVQGVEIGRLLPSQGCRILINASNPQPEQFAKTERTRTMNAPVEKKHSSDCCNDVFDSEGKSGGPGKHFAALMKSVQAAGALDARTKELILFALVLQSRCGPCFETHLKKAASLGITQAELDEAAWCAIAMGGAPVKAFYDSQSR